MEQDRWGWRRGTPLPPFARPKSPLRALIRWLGFLLARLTLLRSMMPLLLSRLFALRIWAFSLRAKAVRQSRRERRDWKDLYRSIRREGSNPAVILSGQRVRLRLQRRYGGCGEMPRRSLKTSQSEPCAKAREVSEAITSSLSWSVPISHCRSRAGKKRRS